MSFSLIVPVRNVNRSAAYMLKVHNLKLGRVKMAAFDSSSDSWISNSRPSTWSVISIGICLAAASVYRCNFEQLPQGCRYSFTACKLPARYDMGFAQRRSGRFGLTEYNHICPACGSADCRALPVPHPTRSMISDGVVTGKPLKRSSCTNCGHGFHFESLSERDVREIYGDNYSIGLRDTAAEVERSLEYDRQVRGFLADLVSETHFTKIIEFGCGSGTLLNHLTTNLEVEFGIGVEPSAKVAAYASSIAGERVFIQQGFAEQFADTAQRDTLCLSVNVIEHASNPLAFLQACARTIDETGRVLIVCPDGEAAGSELLFYDHISSFTSRSLATIAARARLTAIADAPLTGVLKGFRIYLFRLMTTVVRSNCGDFQSLADQRIDYLRTWSKIAGAVDQTLVGQKYGVFGAGEYCDLLHAYTPALIEGAMFLVADRPLEKQLYDKLVISTEEFLKSAPISLIAAVHERNWRVIHDRFKLASVPIIHPFEVVSQDALR